MSLSEQGDTLVMEHEQDAAENNIAFVERLSLTLVIELVLAVMFCFRYNIYCGKKHNKKQGEY
mgnify:FL=1